MIMVLRLCLEEGWTSKSTFSPERNQETGEKEDSKCRGKEGGREGIRDSE
jgi:hypothetical protein